MAQKRQLVWFRNDLRSEDHTALHHAARRGPVIALTTCTLGQWRQYGHGDNKLDFRQRGLKALAERLAALNIPLRVIDDDYSDALPEKIVALAEALSCEALHFNDEYGLNERRCDREVVRLGHERALAVHRYTDRIGFAPGELLTGKGDYYSVFTPFYKSWLRHIEASRLRQYPAPAQQTALQGVESDAVPDIEFSTSVIDEKHWPAGEAAAQARLEQFLNQRASRYAEARDFPAIEATSGLSAWLSLGMISWRQCVNAAAARNDRRLGDGDASLTAWIRALVWREFYQHVLVGFPRVNRHEPFRENTRSLAWRQSDSDFERWCRGETGYPLVDAAMRQLTTTGWMHNRLRMVTAMFLSKHLLVDWRRGEAFFLKHLVDGELGANNGGWQWAASTGTDASPWFRIFNPITQSKRCDPEGTFIARFLPGFDGLPPHQRHDPDADTRRQIGYPEAIVDHRAGRARALKAFGSLG